MEPLMPYDWKLENIDGKNVIFCWALNKNSESVLLKITNYPSSCHLELPINVNNVKINWAEKIEHVLNYLKFRLKGNSPTSYKFFTKEKLYYYRKNTKYPFLLLTFENDDALKHLSNTVNKGPVNIRNLGDNIPLNVWEAEINTVRKFLSIKQLEYTQWFNATSYIEHFDDNKISNCKHEYEVVWRNIHSIDNSQTMSWKVKPRILAYDIETYSPNHKAMPDEDNSECVVYMISCIYHQIYTNDTRKYALIIGDCNPITDVTIVKCADEIDLIRKFEKLLIDTDPEIITGYNILGYDYHYLDRRLRKQGENWDIAGRLLEKKSEMVNKTWKSAAFGHNRIADLKIPGRINIDLMLIVKRSKLDMYNLNFVAKHYLDKTKHDVKADEMFKIYEENQKNNTHEQKIIAINSMTRVMEYCVQDSVLVIELFNKLDTWMDCVQQSSILGVTITEIFTRGQQVKCISQVYNECFKENIVFDRIIQDNFEFEGGFVGDPIQGLHENIICLDFASMYPSIIAAKNISYETLVAPEYESIIDDNMCNTYEVDSKIIAPDYDSDDDDEPDRKKNDKKYLVYKFKFVKTEVKVGILPKIVTKLVAERKSVKNRMEEEKEKIDKDNFLISLLDRRANALKISANSMFGFLGVKERDTPVEDDTNVRRKINFNSAALIQGAMAITHEGRNSIQCVNNELKDKYGGTIVYNDTDSVMVDIGIKDPKICVKKGKELGDKITNMFPPPIKIEFEKSMRIICFKKKKYAYLEIDKNGNFKIESDKNNKPKLDENGNYIYKVNVKGILTARRDNCKFVRDLYTKCLYSILCLNTLDKTFSIVLENIKNLINNKIDIKDLVIIRGLGSNYKSENYFMKIFSDELRKKNKNVVPGDRLQYLILDKQNEPLLGKKMELLEDYLESPSKIDIKHYLENLIKNPIEQLVYIGHMKDFKNLEHIIYRGRTANNNVKKNTTSIKNFIEIILYELYDLDIDKIIDNMLKILTVKKNNLVIQNVID